MNVQLQPASTANVDAVAAAASASVARRRATLIAGSIMIVVVAAIVYSSYRDNTLYVWTVNGQVIQIGSLNARHLDSANIADGRAAVLRYGEFVLNQPVLLAHGGISILVGVLLITVGLLLLGVDHVAGARARRRTQVANQAREPSAQSTTRTWS